MLYRAVGILSCSCTRDTREPGRRISLAIQTPRSMLKTTGLGRRAIRVGILSHVPAMKDGVELFSEAPTPLNTKVRDRLNPEALNRKPPTTARTHRHTHRPTSHFAAQMLRTLAHCRPNTGTANFRPRRRRQYAIIWIGECGVLSLGSGAGVQVSKRVWTLKKVL